MRLCVADVYRHADADPHSDAGRLLRGNAWDLHADRDADVYCDADDDRDADADLDPDTGRFLWSDGGYLHADRGTTTL